MKRIEYGASLDKQQDVYWKDKDGIWWIYLVGCGTGGLKKHQIEEHEDGTISVSPSILMNGHSDGTPSQRHGYL